MKLFRKYGEYSGQLINVAKTTFYTGSIPLARKHAIAVVPFTYMGVPLFQGNTKARIKVKLARWKGL